MKAGEPEGLFPEVREQITKQIARIIETGESFRIRGLSGVGKSKYLRYISSSKKVNDKYFKSTKPKLVYIDLNRLFDKSTQSLVDEMSKRIGCSGNTPNAIEDKISQLLKTHGKVYFIMDQFERMRDMENGAVRLLRSFRDEYKYQLGYILSYEDDQVFNKDTFRYLFEITSLEIIMEPLNDEDALFVTRQAAEINNIELTPEEEAFIVKTAKGLPKYIKQMITHRRIGRQLEDIARVITHELAVLYKIGTPDELSLSDKISDANLSVKEDSIDPDIADILARAQKLMTKSEGLFFRDLLMAKGDIVERDKFAEILSPESHGDGVSNEAIDQVISRLRRALKVNAFPHTIKNKRGVGYYLEDV